MIWPRRSGEFVGLLTKLRHWVVLTAALIGVIVALLGVRWYSDASSSHEPVAARATDRATTRPTPRQTDRPNIVFVLTDDLSTDLLQFMPHVQELQRRGMAFSHYFVTNSLCCPSRATILTGGHPHTTGVLTNGGSDGGNPEFEYRQDDEQTFATSLQSAGYLTAMMGKYLNGYRVSDPKLGPRGAVPPGWTEWSVPGLHDGYSGYDYTLNESGRLVHYGHAPTDYLTDVMSAKGADFIRRAAAAEKPFLLHVSTFSPHAPYTPAPRHLDAFPGLTYPRTPAFDRASTLNTPRWLAAHKPISPEGKNTIDQVFRKRAQAVLSVDELVANLMNTLEAEGLLENTYVVFSSDNGYHMGEHRLPIGKMTAFDTDVRVPLIVAGPGVAAGTTSDALTANIDLCPTFESLGKGTNTLLVDGHNLVPLLHGEPQSEWRKAVLVEHTRPESDAQAGPDTEPRTGSPPSYFAMRLQDSVYVEHADGQREYYDIAKDPHQLSNLAPQLTPARRTALHRSVTAMSTCHGAAACWAAATAAGE